MMQNSRSVAPHFAVIGAGLAGAYLAQQLNSCGIQVTVFEKSRGTGGRLSSCRLGDTSADLGAPYFHCDTQEFADWLSNQSVIDTWTPATQDFSGKELTPESYFIGQPRQSVLTRQLLADPQLMTQTRVGYIWPELEAGQQTVLLRDEQGKALGSFDGAIVTAPAQQAAKLLEAVPRFSKQADEIGYEISWVAVLEIAGDTFAIEADLIIGEHPILARCVRDSAKPGRQEGGNSTWFIEANSAWSKTHQDSDTEMVTQRLIDAFSAQLSGPVEIRSQRIHRWLYSRHNTPEDSKHSGFLWDEQSRIGACGDWLMAQDAEGAWLSAAALAAHIQAQLAQLQSA